MLVLNACHLQNQSGAVMAVDAGGAGSQTASISGLNALTVLTSPASAQSAFCPAAKVYVDNSLGEALVSSCKGCHSQGRNGFDLDLSLAEGAAFVELIDYLREKTEDGGRAEEHVLVTKAQGASHGGAAVWSSSSPKLAVLADLVSAELRMPCDPDATLRRAAEVEGSEDASGDSSSSDESVDEEF